MGTEATAYGVPLRRRLSYTSSLTLANQTTIIDFSDFVVFEILFICLATDICTVEEAFCVLFVEFVVDDVLAVFDGVCCCD